MARALSTVAVLLATTSIAGVPTLTGRVAYMYVDQNGFGWVTTDGKVDVTLTFRGKGGTLRVVGTSAGADGEVVMKGSPPKPDMKGRTFQGQPDETFSLTEVTQTGQTVTFRVAIPNQQVTGRCAPTTVEGLSLHVLHECSFDGFESQTVPSRPELRHPLVLASARSAKTRIVNTMQGSTRKGFGQRTVTAEPRK